MIDEDGQIKEVDLPLFVTLEQRVSHLENTFATYQVDNVTIMTDAVAHKFKTNISAYLPTIKQHLEEL